MSISKDFFNQFCQPIADVQYNEQNVVDDFMQFIKSNCTGLNNSEIIITYIFPKKFVHYFGKAQVISILKNVLINQMKFKQKIFGYGFISNMFHFVKKETTYQYNEPYTRYIECWNEDPDGIDVKFFVRK